MNVSSPDFGFRLAMCMSSLINTSGGVALLLGKTPPSLAKLPMTQETCQTHMAMQGKGFFILGLGIFNYLCSKNRENTLFVKSVCDLYNNCNIHISHMHCFYCFFFLNVI